MVQDYNGNNNVNININEIVNNQNNQQINNETDKYIDELLKKSFTSPSVSTNSGINLDVFFGQNDNTKIDDALIDKLFESAGKPLIESQSKTNNNLNPQNHLHIPKTTNPNQIKEVIPYGNTNYPSPVNSPQKKLNVRTWEFSEQTTSQSKITKFVIYLIF